MNTVAQISAPFNGVELLIVEYNNQPYTAMRPIVEGMGLAWQAQFDKLKQRFNSVIMEIMTTGKDGKNYQMLCLPLKKLFGWLMTISPNKVKPELRDTVIKYQEECDDVLWDYWTKGQAVNPRTTKVERTPLHDAHAMLVAKTKHLNSSDAWKLILQRFDVKSIKDIPYDEIPVAVEYVHHLIALYSNAEKQKFTDVDLQNIHALATHMIWVREWWRVYGESIEKLNPTLYSRVIDHLTGGSCLAWRFVKSDQKQQLEECVKSFDWMAGTYQQKLPI